MPKCGRLELIDMPEHPLAEIAKDSKEKDLASAAYRVLYDGQCEICQACVSWLKFSIRRSGRSLYQSA